MNKNISSDTFETSVHDTLVSARQHLRRTACMIVEIDDFDTLLDRYGLTGADHVQRTVAEKLNDYLRQQDRLFHLANGQFGIILEPVRKLGTDDVLEVAKRLQNALDAPLSLGSTFVYISVSIGICLDTFVQGHRGSDLTKAAGIALLDARRHGPTAIRTYSPELQYFLANIQDNELEVSHALENGEIRAWFQPQVSTDTGEVCGFEALARWEHPTRGVIPPSDFLSTVQTTGQAHVLGAKILRDALTALQQWDHLGWDIAQVGVNFSQEELRDPKLTDRVQFELDTFGVEAKRLAIEVLETVVSSSPDDTVTRNIRRLAELGCFIDLDDFGTGHTSIASIRRFGVKRLKIDRSFVTKVDCDPEQQRIVNAIQLMAEQLDLETLAEGVETAGEHAMLAQLGCQYVQGFGLGRPMPLEDTYAWIGDHLARVQTPPKIGRA
ncbi:putative bifunctional diguanylate cyclase/phosphodiesterase [Roseovarius rhodophyticola]|uniref:Bifunctional diguanylate cyclase/phosphodiesterase n=1 Tax=Roseovarius rhodophyticola TaxID=3080827 RepID=A0ABZ2TII8_9RHOB|nr:bifunctional diguanylate cyclase/phosphodiesterase [Roseovarius sp. W115]MDV2929841.1 bifunctional diguanylate cyclase/phosphodiesterase [Roseovarius sp. W115]